MSCAPLARALLTLTLLMASNEVTVVGSRCGPFPAAIKALVSGQVDVSALISKVFPLSQALEALEAAGSDSTIKVLIHVP